jgi:hypothetical protein
MKISGIVSPAPEIQGGPIMDLEEEMASPNWQLLLVMPRESNGESR